MTKIFPGFNCDFTCMSACETSAICKDMAQPKACDICDIKNFPDQFSLKSYESCKEWVDRDWYNALLYRYQLSTRIRRVEEGQISLDLLKAEFQTLRGEIEDLLLNPTAKRDVNDFDLRLTPIMSQNLSEYFEAFFICSENSKYKQWLDLYTIASMEGCSTDQVAYPLLELTLWDEIAIRNYPVWRLHNDVNAGKNPLEVLNYPIWELCTEPLERERKKFHPDRVFASVDLKNSDEFLKESFANWLKLIRKQTNIYCRKKRFNVDDFKKWCEQLYLPFLDIYLWGGVNKPLTYAVIGNLLFPDNWEKADPENVRKTIKKNALNLISPETIKALRSQFLFSEQVAKK